MVFSKLDCEVNSHDDYRCGVAILIETIDSRAKKLFIDFNDNNRVHEGFYEWCDTYAKINVKPCDIDRKKILPIGPSFGVTLWNPIKTIIIALKHWIKWNDVYTEPLLSYLKDYSFMFFRRLDYSRYHTCCKEDRNYLFSLNTLWYDEDTFATTNRLRGVFMQACKEIYGTFDGGFFYIDLAEVQEQFPKYKQYLTEYTDILTKTRISMKEYLTRTQKSSFVFNTPSVCGCHGWKLGEYLAMGKAIISTPLNNVMPGDFLNGEHFIEVNSNEEIYAAVKHLHNNPDVIEKLKIKSAQYFNQYLSPTAVARRILTNLFE